MAAQWNWSSQLGIMEVVCYRHGQQRAGESKMNSDISTSSKKTHVEYTSRPTAFAPYRSLICISSEVFDLDERVDVMYTEPRALLHIFAPI